MSWAPDHTFLDGSMPAQIQRHGGYIVKSRSADAFCHLTTSFGCFLAPDHIFLDGSMSAQIQRHGKYIVKSRSADAFCHGHLTTLFLDGSMPAQLQRHQRMLFVT